MTDITKVLNVQILKILLQSNILFFRMIKKKANKSAHHTFSRVTFRTESALISILQEFRYAKSKLDQLMGSTMINSYNIGEIISLCQRMPKSLQRNKNLANELQMFSNFGEVVDSFLKGNCKRKYKPYNIFSIWKSLEIVLRKRIQQGVKGSYMQNSNNVDHIKLFNFLKEVQNVSCRLQDWTKKQTKQNIKHSAEHKYVMVFPQKRQQSSQIKTYNTNRQTLQSTAYVTRNPSKHQKTFTYDDFMSLKSKRQLDVPFRSSTAKLQKKQLKLSVRCPSAAQLLKKQSFVQPSFQFKRVIKKKYPRSTDFQSQKNRNFYNRVHKLSKKVLIINNEEPNIDLQDNLENLQTKRKVSVLNQSFVDNNQEDDKDIKIKKSFKNQTKSFDEIKIMQRKQSSIENQIVFEQREQFGTMKSIRRAQNRKATIFSTRNRNNSFSIKNHSSDQQIEIRSIQSSCQEQQQLALEDRITKNRLKYKTIRRSGRIVRRQSDSNVVQETNVGVKRSVKDLSRRKAMINTQKTLKQVQEVMKEEHKKAELKQIEFSQNVFLAVADALKVKSNIQFKKQSVQKMNSLHTFNSKYAQLNNFIKNPQFSDHEQGSAFFMQQQKIRSGEDINIKQRMKILMKKSQGVNIFELCSSEQNNKDMIYNQIDRNLCFQSDEQWIKNTYSVATMLQQKEI